MHPWVLTLTLWLFSWPVLRDSVDRLIFVSQSHGTLPLVDQRYVDHPVAVFVHLLPGLLFFVIGPLQFNSTLRRYRQLHRWIGYIYCGTVLISSVGVMYMVFAFPALGGTLTIAVTWAICLAMCAAILAAIQAARVRHFMRHQSLMRLSFALGMTVATARHYISAGQTLFDVPFVDSFTVASALGLMTNLAVLIWLERRGLLRLWLDLRRSRA